MSALRTVPARYPESRTALERVDPSCQFPIGLCVSQAALMWAWAEDLPLERCGNGKAISTFPQLVEESAPGSLLDE